MESENLGMPEVGRRRGKARGEAARLVMGAGIACKERGIPDESSKSSFGDGFGPVRLERVAASSRER